VPELQLASLALPPLTQPFAPAVDQAIADSDGMLEAHATAREHYFTIGASALNAILAAVALANMAPKSILDFGCGAGRVMRWLRAAFPAAAISACDVRELDLEFVGRRFGAQTWKSGVDVAALAAPGPIDLIWVGSVVTHLDEATSLALLRKLFSWLNPQGLLIASLHGRGARGYGEAGLVTYLQRPDDWRRVVAQCQMIGYGYADYPDQTGYGISLASPQWTTGLVERIPGSQLVMFGEMLWDNHHDVVALKKSK
jgi:SAM-dependent methyltransferase